MWVIVLLFGFIFAFASLFAFPLLGSAFFGSQRDLNRKDAPIKDLDILIPCHNEQGKLRKTLTSLQSAITEAQGIFPSLICNVVVGLDDCDDNTKDDVNGFDASIHEFSYRSKWKVLSDLVKSASADWIALVDAGTLWDQRLLRNVIPHWENENIMCVAPTYRTLGGRFFGKTFWKVEAKLKTIENTSGGPISVHGATVFYRRKNLAAALLLLEGRQWLNDDIVIPLILRLAFPKSRILYTQNESAGFAIYDAAPREKARERAARHRIALGNIQWVKHLIPLTVTMNPLIFLVALRRIFRMSWILSPLMIIASVFVLSFELLHQGQNSLVPIFILASSSLFLAAFLRQPSVRASWHAVKCLLSRTKVDEDEHKWG